MQEFCLIDIAGSVLAIFILYVATYCRFLASFMLKLLFCTGVEVARGPLAVRFSVLQCVVVCCSVLQFVAVCCSVLQYVAVCCSVLHCNTLQRTARGPFVLNVLLSRDFLSRSQWTGSGACDCARDGVCVCVCVRVRVRVRV